MEILIKLAAAVMLLGANWLVFRTVLLSDVDSEPAQPEPAPVHVYPEHRRAA